MYNNSLMSHKERIIAALSHEETDYSPCVVYFCCPPKAIWGGKTYNFAWSQNIKPEKRIKYIVEELGISQIVNFEFPTRRIHSDVKSQVWKEGDILYKQYDTPAGSVRAAVKYTANLVHGEDIPFSTDWSFNFIEPWIDNEQDLECIKYLFIPWEPNKDEYATLKESYRTIRHIADMYELPVSSVCGKGLTLGLQLFQPEKISLKTLENPDLIHSYLETEHRCTMKALDIAGEMGVDIIRRNGFHETTDFYSPNMLDMFLSARLTEEIKKTHTYGMKMIYTAHTGVMPMLEYLKHLKMDCIFGIDIAYPGVSLERIRDKLFDKKSFFIGPSGTHHLWDSNPEVTRKVVRKIYTALGRNGVILGPCVSMQCIMPWENLLAMIDEWKKFR